MTKTLLAAALLGIFMAQADVVHADNPNKHYVCGNLNVTLVWNGVISVSDPYPVVSAFATRAGKRYIFAKGAISGEFDADQLTLELNGKPYSCKSDD